MKKNYKFGVTVFTPTFNRSKTLSRLYESLVNQKNKEFEWLIIDDGSTDDTKKIVNQFKKENKVLINYYYQDNHGKSFAFNEAVKKATYNLFYCVDSDDFIGENTIQEINDINKKIIKDENIVGIMGFKKNIRLLNNSRKYIKEEKLMVSELYRKHHFNDEIALAYKTELLINHLFPIIKGEKFVPEGFLHDQMDVLGKCYFLKKNIYYYEYLNDGYTNNSIKLLSENINGYILYSRNRLENSPLWQNKVRGAIQYNISNLVANNGLSYMKNKYFLLLFITFIPSFFYYLLKYRIRK